MRGKKCTSRYVPCKGQSPLVVVERRHFLGTRIEARRGRFPQAPAPRCLELRSLAVAGETLVVGSHHVLAFLPRYEVDVLLPRVGVDVVGAVSLVEPRELLPSYEENAAQDNLRDLVGMGDGIAERKGAAP